MRSSRRRRERKVFLGTCRERARCRASITFRAAGNDWRRQAQRVDSGNQVADVDPEVCKQQINLAGPRELYRFFDTVRIAQVESSADRYARCLLESASRSTDR